MLRPPLPALRRQCVWGSHTGNQHRIGGAGSPETTYPGSKPRSTFLARQADPYPPCPKELLPAPERKWKPLPIVEP
jgi:hypothetical protein